MELIFLKKTFIIGIKIWRLKTTHCQHSNSLIGIGFKKTTCSRCLMVKLYTQFKTQDSEINKAFSGICHQDEIRGVSASPPPTPPVGNDTNKSLNISQQPVKLLFSAL